MLTKGAYVVKVDGKRIAAYKENYIARSRAAWYPNAEIVWERNGFTATFDEIHDRKGA